MEMTIYIILILTILISYMFLYSTWNTFYRNKNLPPGPMPLPIIGNVLHIHKGELVKSLNQLKEKYGSIYTLYFGSRPVVILCGYQMVKEVLVDRGEEFSDRGRLPTVDRFFKGHGVIFANGENWKQLRRFTLTTFRNFGMGKRSIEERIQEEVQFLIEELRNLRQSPVNPTNILLQSMSNVACSVLFGQRFDYKDLKFLKIVQNFNEAFRLMGSTWGQLHDLMPEILDYIPGPHQNIDTILHEQLEYVSERVKLNQETLDPSNPRDYIDCFLIKMIQESQNPTSQFNIKTLLLNIVQLFFAGTETVSGTLRHGLLLLLHYPEIQEKLHNEIDKVIGSNRLPSVEDRSKMPYMDAVIHEIQRFSDVLPLNLPHTPVRDIEFHGYTIPKGTDVYPMLFWCLRDPDFFKNPEKFDPGHFLDDNGCLKAPDAFVPFSTGKRVCAGEGLARMELFLFLTTILQNFKLTSKTTFTNADVKPKLTGFSNIPIAYELSFVPR
ncbi:cytochrome P450 2G1-like [Hyperolius riggenbachi]|uniref:cytochrome P450 2G1-like n=1 Tax=Hyperolius riggenbachi TaxID=752182 RepID=UPI0035A33A2D